MKRATQQAEDAALFRAAIGKVAPLPEQNRMAQPQRVPHWRHATPPAPAIPDTLSDYLSIDTPESFLRNGLCHKTLRRLRRSPIEDSIDLHGDNIEQARMRLQQFLHEARARDLRHVLVIHGKGNHGGVAILKRLARHWLTQRAEVLAYCDALPLSGGSGATLTLLKALYAPQPVQGFSEEIPK